VGFPAQIAQLTGELEAEPDNRIDQRSLIVKRHARPRLQLQARGKALTGGGDQDLLLRVLLLQLPGQAGDQQFRIIGAFEIHQAQGLFAGFVQQGPSKAPDSRIGDRSKRGGMLLSQAPRQQVGRRAAGDQPTGGNRLRGIAGLYNRRGGEAARRLDGQLFLRSRGRSGAIQAGQMDNALDSAIGALDAPQLPGNLGITAGGQVDGAVAPLAQGRLQQSGQTGLVPLGLGDHQPGAIGRDEGGRFRAVHGG